MRGGSAEGLFIKVMREIKFRGKCIANSEWLYGYLHLPIGGENLMIQVTNTDSFGVIPNTVGQFTGLHDKYGKEIYEGDIVRFDNHLQGLSKVLYDRGQYTVESKNYSTALTYRIAIHTIIVGNIHDNPELL